MYHHLPFKISLIMNIWKENCSNQIRVVKINAGFLMGKKTEQWRKDILTQCRESMTNSCFFCVMELSKLCSALKANSSFSPNHRNFVSKLKLIINFNKHSLIYSTDRSKKMNLKEHQLVSSKVLCLLHTFLYCTLHVISRWSGDVIWRTGKNNFNAVSHNRARP